MYESFCQVDLQASLRRTQGPSGDANIFWAELYFDQRTICFGEHIGLPKTQFAVDKHVIWYDRFTSPGGNTIAKFGVYRKPVPEQPLCCLCPEETAWILRDQHRGVAKAP